MRPAANRMRSSRRIAVPVTHMRFEPESGSKEHLVRNRSIRQNAGSDRFGMRLVSSNW